MELYNHRHALPFPLICQTEKNHEIFKAGTPITSLELTAQIASLTYAHRQPLQCRNSDLCYWLFYANDNPFSCRLLINWFFFFKACVSLKYIDPCWQEKHTTQYPLISLTHRIMDLWKISQWDQLLVMITFFSTCRATYEC